MLIAAWEHDLLNASLHLKHVCAQHTQTEDEFLGAVAFCMPLSPVLACLHQPCLVLGLATAIWCHACHRLLSKLLQAPLMAASCLIKWGLDKTKACSNLQELASCLKPIWASSGKFCQVRTPSSLYTMVILLLVIARYQVISRAAYLSFASSNVCANLLCSLLPLLYLHRNTSLASSVI